MNALALPGLARCPSRYHSTRAPDNPRALLRGIISLGPGELAARLQGSSPTCGTSREPSALGALRSSRGGAAGNAVPRAGSPRRGGRKPTTSSRSSSDSASKKVPSTPQRRKSKGGSSRGGGRRNDAPGIREERADRSSTDDHHSNKGGSRGGRDPTRPTKTPVEKLRPGSVVRDDAELDEAARAWLQTQKSTPRSIQWYPGHMKEAEKALREALGGVDIVLDVRDARCPASSGHPRLPEWSAGVPRVLVLNRVDCVPQAAYRAWQTHLREAGHPAIVCCEGRSGRGVERIVERALEATERVRAARARRGLLPRAMRLAVVGYPNVGKSAIINRLVGRRAAPSAPRPGITRRLSWVRLSDELELLDAPGILPPNLRDQEAATKLAICDDIGEASYSAAAVAASFLALLPNLGAAGRAATAALARRHGIDCARSGQSPEEAVEALAERRFNAEPERAGQRILREFRELAYGRLCLDRFAGAVDVQSGRSPPPAVEQT